MNYDIIGDIHGHSDELEILLQKLGYRLIRGVYSHHENRQVIFLGDFIDRGPKIRETLHIVKNMCDEGHAKAIMGNHEFNAICFHEPSTKEGGFFREHSLKNINQHFETLKQFQHFDNEWNAFLEWFKDLPLFLELNGFRVVHAYWNENHIDWIKKSFDCRNHEILYKSSQKDGGFEEYTIIEETLKGTEEKLPEDHSFLDKDGIERYECRTKWWSEIKSREKYKDFYIDCPVSLASEIITHDTSKSSYNSNIPVFIGHYWLTKSPQIENTKAICLDYSVAKGGKLVAYQFDSNSKHISDKNFVY
jgi:hypothetical protein